MNLMTGVAALFFAGPGRCLAGMPGVWREVYGVLEQAKQPVEKPQAQPAG